MHDLPESYVPHEDPAVFYDKLSRWYDAMIDWPKRLAREIPTLTAFLRGHRARQVLDVACGSGRQTWALAEQGFEMTGADLSEAMLEEAVRHRRPAGTLPHFVVWNPAVEAFPGGQARFDAALCLGNSLPHLPDDASAVAFLAGIGKLLPGGLLLLQMKNLDHPTLRESPRFAEREVDVGGQRYRIVRRYVYGEPWQDKVLFVWEVFDMTGKVVERTGTRLRIYSNSDLDRVLRAAGYAAPEFASPGETIPLPVAGQDWVLWTRQVS